VVPAVHGFPALIVSMLFLGGLQLLCMGMLGEYVARIFTETKGRPIYLIDIHEPATVPSKSKSNAVR
jgi:glycosyltransferase involved in cell wall biosynthesis